MCQGRMKSIYNGQFGRVVRVVKALDLKSSSLEIVVEPSSCRLIFFFYFNIFDLHIFYLPIPKGAILAY